MFDISFTELLVIAIVALIVIGPQRLPAVARTLGHLVGRMQRCVNDVKADISREMELDELKKLQSSMEDAARSMRDSVDSVGKDASEVGNELNRMAQSTGDEAEPRSDSPPSGPAPAPGSPQAELPLEPGQQAPAQKRA